MSFVLQTEHVPPTGGKPIYYPLNLKELANYHPTSNPTSNPTSDLNTSTNTGSKEKKDTQSKITKSGAK
jgi:hypothetical protein